MTVLLIGPTLGKSKAIGGTTVSFEQLSDYVKDNGIVHMIVPINKYGNRIASYFFCVYKCLLHLHKSDVVFLNVSSSGVKYLSPILYCLSRMFSNKFVLRVFGGDLNEIYNNSNYIIKSILRKSSFKCELFLVQTKKLCEIFSGFSENIHWLPTSRPKSEFSRPSRDYQKKFVYIGSICQSKGVVLLAKVFSNLSASFSLDIYGPVDDHKLLDKIRPYYRGILNPEKVQKTLSNYDFLCFPTFWKGEGYPGVVLESYSVGVPVISTRWNSIPEIVHDGVTGYLIDIKSEEQLYQAITKVDVNSYRDFPKNCSKYFEAFRCDLVYSSLFKRIKGL